MAHPAKFVPVNLNKSYGRNSSVSTGGGGTTAGGPHPSRYGRHGNNSGGGGGMVVLSRPKAAPKLSVPPPLNLPSLRKEHEKFDSNGSSANSGRQGLGHGPGSSTMGWTKPAVAKDPSVPDPGTGSRPGGPSLPPSMPQGVTEKAVLLKGEDFPTLRAATHTPPSKQRDGSSRIEKKKVTGEDGLEKRPLSPMLMDMRPQMRPLRSGTGNSSDKGEGAGLEKQRKADEPLTSLPRVDYKSDWEDDERKTSLSLPERDFGAHTKHEPAHDTSARDLEVGGFKEVYRGDPFGKYSAYANKDSRDNSWRSPGMNQRGDRYGSHESDRNYDTRPYSAGRGNNTQSIYNGNRDWHSKRDPLAQTYNHVGAEEHSTGWHRGNQYHNNSGPKPYMSPLNNNKGVMANDVLDLRREKRTTLGPANPVSYLEDLDDIGDVNVKVLKKKKELQKPTEFHDPVRESFEAELDQICRMHEMERQRALEERTRAIEMARREEEERERIVREERERLAKEEEEARKAVWLAEQEKLEAAKRAEEQRIAREEEKRQLMLEEERRKEAARKKLLELEARIARRQAEAHVQGESNDNTTVQLETKDAPGSVASYGDRDDGERVTERLNTGSSDSSSMNRYFDTGISSGTVSRWSNMRDVASNGNSPLLDRGESHLYYGTRNPIQDQDYPYRSSGVGTSTARRNVFGPGPVRRSYGRKDQQPYDSMRMPRWDNNPGFNRPLSDFESDYVDGDRLGDAGWSSPSNSTGSPHAQYDTSTSFSPFTRYRYGSRQPRVLPPPAVTSTHRGPITERTGPCSSSTIGRNDVHSMGTSYVDVYQETSQLHVTEPSLVERESHVADAITHLDQSEEKASAMCNSQSSLSVSSPPVSPPHVSHDEMDVSGDLPAPPTSAETPQSYNENGDIDRASDLSGAITDVEDEEWGPEENPDEMNRPVEYEGEEEEGHLGLVNEGAGSNLDLQRDFGDVAGDTEQIILGFDEGVQVQIPRNGSVFESQKVIEMDSLPSASVKEPINVLNEESTILRETEKAIRDLSLEQPIKSANSPLMPSQDKLANISGLPTPIVPPVKPIMPPSSTQAVSSQAELPPNLQFGLFSRPSLIPTPIPAIQIGSIQMPIHLHTQMSPSIHQMHPSPAPLFQFGQFRYASSVVSQGITTVPSQAIQSFVHAAGPSNPYIANQNQTSTNATTQTNTETLVSLSHKNMVAASQSNVPSKSQTKESEKPKERTSLMSSGKKELEVQPQPGNNEMRASNGSKGPIIASSGPRGRRYGSNYNNPPREHNMRFAPPSSEVSHKDLRGGYRRVRRNIRRTEHRVRENSERRDKPVNELPIQENGSGASVVGVKDTPRPKDDVLESGVVRVFEQPGIEVPTDADGFIEVRSKKQMLNDRREKREREKEKEIRPKPRMQKVSRKQNTGAVARFAGPNFNRTTKEVVDTTGKNLSKVQSSVQLTGSSTSKSFPPIGTPAKKFSEPDPDPSFLKTNQPTKIEAGLSFEGTTVAKKPLALGSWESSHANQQVMPLTQSQLEEAMKPVQFEQQPAVNTFSLEPSKPIISAQQKPSPINSLLAGEKIQFGVVTSPIIPVSRPAAPNGLGAPGSSRPAPSMKTELPSMHLFDKGKATAEATVSVRLDKEAEDEAEAAASAVAVAAISNDEVVVGTVGDAVPVEQKNISSADAPVSTSGAPNNREPPSQSTSTEESSSLTVALPADLSVDTPSLTMWPALPSPQSTAPNPMLSQFPSAQPSHFSCFEMNPMLGGAHHIFAFGPNDESAQSHAQRAAAGGQLGTWSGPHPSGVDSFYRPPAGYGGPFIGPGGIQGPPHMVVYNHFAPVGQFGQVGLSFVGPAAYVPTEKHPEWKQLPHTHSVAPAGQVDVNRQNLGPGAGVSQGMPVPGQGQIQHLRPTSPLMQLPMFDISPFQPTGEVPVQACWPHMPPGPPPLHSGPHSVTPLQQHQIDLQLGQLGHNHQSQPVNNVPHFHEPPANSDNRRAPQFPEELGMVERSVSTTNTASAQSVLPSLVSNDEGSSAMPIMKPTPTTLVNASEKRAAAVGNTTAMVKGQHATVIDKRGKNEWNRRGGHYGRRPGSGQTKQVYVVKTSVTGSTSTPSTATNN